MTKTLKSFSFWKRYNYFLVLTDHQLWQFKLMMVSIGEEIVMISNKEETIISKRIYLDTNANKDNVPQYNSSFFKTQLLCVLDCKVDFCRKFSAFTNIRILRSQISLYEYFQCVHALLNRAIKMNVISWDTLGRFLFTRGISMNLYKGNVYSWIINSLRSLE